MISLGVPSPEFVIVPPVGVAQPVSELQLVGDPGDELGKRAPGRL